MAVIRGNGERADHVNLYGDDDHTEVHLPDGGSVWVHSTGAVVRFEKGNETTGFALTPAGS